MTKKMLLLAVIVALPVSVYLSTRSNLTDVQTALVEQYYIQTEKCRGGDPIKDSTWEACRFRDDLVVELVESGLCFGRDGQAEYQRQWQHCAKSNAN